MRQFKQSLMSGLVILAACKNQPSASVTIDS